MEGLGLIIEIEPIQRQAVCPRCGKISKSVHQNHRYYVRDLPISLKDVLLRVNRRQFKCSHCKKPFSEKLKYVEKGKTYTTRFAEEIVKQVIGSNIASVARKNDLTEEEIESMVSLVAQENLDIDLTNLKRLGIDEIALRKGHKNFVTILVDLDTGKLIGLVKERKSKTLACYLESWGKDILNQIEEVSIDLYKMYKTVIEKKCPFAVITADRFHVTKILHQELNQARIDQKKTAESLEIKQREKLFSTADPP
ncbi:MAG: ISL3 family transposase [Okeania sp. SIO2D1]|nr:ISL3 family transposase [Okeania sp. SIO2D1]